MGDWSGYKTAELLDREDSQHGSGLSDQVGQLQSKLDRAAFQRNLIVGMEPQKKDPQVRGYQNGPVVYKQPST